MTRAALYFGEVVHERKRPRAHRLRYKVFSVLVDVDQLDKISSASKLFAYNKWGLFSIYDRDHGTCRSKEDGIADWVRDLLIQSGHETGAHRIKLLCYPRILGYVFNPLSVYFCYAETGKLNSIIYEVHNTFGERHTYLIEVEEPSGKIICQSGNKEFFVSPFIAMDCQYKFRVQAPNGHVRVVMRVEDTNGLIMAASFNAERHPFSDFCLAKAFVRFPLMTAKVIAGIHLEALRLWLKKIPYFQHSPSSKIDLADKSK